MLLPVYLLMGIINILANSQNFNINSKRHPKMDIRVRRDIEFVPYHNRNTVQNTVHALRDIRDKHSRPYIDSDKVLNSAEPDNHKSTINLKKFLNDLTKDFTTSETINNREKRSYNNNYNNSNNGYYNGINNGASSYKMIKYNHGYYYIHPNNTNSLNNGNRNYNQNYVNNGTGYYKQNNTTTNSYNAIKYNHGIYYLNPNITSFINDNNISNSSYNQHNAQVISYNHNNKTRNASNAIKYNHGIYYLQSNNTHLITTINNSSHYNRGYFINNTGHYTDNNQTGHPFSTIKYNGGHYFLYPNNTATIIAHNFTNYNNHLGYYPYYNLNTTVAHNSNNPHNNTHNSHHNISYNSNGYNQSIIGNNQPIIGNNQPIIGNNQPITGYNATTISYNASVITTTTKPNIKRTCIIGCNIGCPAFFKKIGIFCVPEDY